MNDIGDFSLKVWFIFPLIMLALSGGIMFMVVHFWRLSRARDLVNEQRRKIGLRKDSDAS